MTVRGFLRLEDNDGEATVTPLELFFDLVFVFALTQVTAYLAHHLSWHGVVQGLAIFGLLWWSWVCYAWVGNVVRADEGSSRFGLFVAMAAMLVLALTIPEAFDDLPGGLPGPVVIALCYLVFRATHLVLFWVISRGDRALRRQTLRFIPSVACSTVLLLVAATLDGWSQTVLWLAALLADYGGNLLAGAQWRLRSVPHFAERHGLVVIIALGESIVAIGVGIAELPISWPIVVAATLGLVVSAALWWVYFDVTSLAAEHALARVPEDDRPRVARDAYSYLHLPIVAGVVLLALGLKKVVEYVGDTGHHSLGDPLTGIGLYALYGGVAVYLLGHVAFKWRTMHVVVGTRIGLAVVLLAALPLVARLPALASLGILAATMIALNIVETFTRAEQRGRIRHGDITPEDLGRH